MEKKQSAIAILDILTTYSDENNILTTKDIQNYLMNIYDLDIERRTLYSNIDLLIEMGYDISKYDDNGKGYYLAERKFDKGEILLLCNAIHSSHFISDKQSNKLINKLLTTLSKYQKKEYLDKVYLPNKQKGINDELIYNIELISEAIRDNKMIEFNYLKYDLNKKLVYKRDKSYIVEPRYIVYADSRAYLIGTNKDYYDFTHYRIDRITKGHLLEDKSKKLPKEFDAYEYAKNKLFMYGGEANKVTFLCEYKVLDHMIDNFGTDVSILPKDKDHFILSVNTSLKGAKLFAQQYLDTIEVLEPKSLREEVKNELKNALKHYNK